MLLLATLNAMKVCIYQHDVKEGIALFTVFADRCCAIDTIFVMSMSKITNTKSKSSQRPNQELDRKS